jgi:hypothetical protein
MGLRVVRTLLFGFLTLMTSFTAFAQLRISVGFGPPALPVYEQPLCPEDGYIWTPGYWAWDADYEDYYWVPGTWVLAPEPGYLWTPPYWAWSGGAFVFYNGYWGPQVGFYGGIDYGFGYFGNGFEGGRWENGRFFYNRSVTNINITNIHNVYNTTVVNDRDRMNRPSYNGGNGGINARPTPQQEAAARQRHLPPVAAQTQHIQAARGNPEFRAATNHGKPPVAATARPGEFRGGAVVPARAAGAPYNPPANRAANQPRGGNEPRPSSPENEGRSKTSNSESRPATHPSELPPMERRPAPNTGSAKLDQKYQQQQQKLQQRQDQQRQKLQQQQEKEHQQLAKQNAPDTKRQATEQRHQQQTQQLQQRHVQEQQKMQQRQAPPAPRPESKPKK